MVADILTRILDWKRQEVAQARQTLPLAELRQRVQAATTNTRLSAGVAKARSARDAYHC